MPFLLKLYQRLESVFDHVLGPPPPKFLGNLGPPFAEQFDGFDQLEVLLNSPLSFEGSWVQMVDPVLTALFTGSEEPFFREKEQVFCDVIPFVSDVP